MSDKKKIMATLNMDSDGFISQECPKCKKQFKIKYGEGSDQPLSFCPYCGHEGRDCWWTQEQADYLGKTVLQETIEPELEKMAKEVNRNSHKGGFITMSMDFKPSSKAVPPQEIDKDWPKMLFECCGETIKHDQGQEVLSCVICGRKLEK